MKNNAILPSLSPSRIFYSLNPATLIFTILFTISTATVFGQSIPASASELSGTVVLANQWRPIDEYTTVITALQNENTISMSAQILQGADLALYTGYSRLLNYIRKDLEEHLPLETLADKNYKRVIAESITDPVLQGLPIEPFTTYYNALVERLHQ